MQMFVATADANYILARTAFFAHYDFEFFWLSAAEPHGRVRYRQSLAQFVARLACLVDFKALPTSCNNAFIGVRLFGDRAVRASVAGRHHLAARKVSEVPLAGRAKEDFGLRARLVRHVDPGIVRLGGTMGGFVPNVRDRAQNYQRLGRSGPVYLETSKRNGLR